MSIGTGTGTTQSVTLIFPHNVYGRIMSHCDGRRLSVSDYIKGLIHHDLGGGAGHSGVSRRRDRGGALSFADGITTDEIRGLMMTGHGHGV